MAHRTSFPHQYKSALTIRLHVINHVHSNVIYGAQNAAECAWKKEHKKKNANYIRCCMHQMDKKCIVQHYIGHKNDRIFCV